MTNILEAIANIVNSPVNTFKTINSGGNRINNVGEALEIFIKDAFAGCLEINDEIQRLQKYHEEFSWLGNQNHPPDIMIRGGDAIEVKKLQTADSSLMLNSSHPKSTALASNSMITSSCRNCEEWIEKDLIYCVGHTVNDSVKSLWMVYGNIYAASHEVYQLIKQKISEGVHQIPNVEFAETNELGRVNRVDPLGTSNLRIRGMWSIQNPKRVFGYVHTSSTNAFEIVALIPTAKYNSFPQESISKIESSTFENLTVKDVQVKDPNNPANFIAAKLIVYNIL